MFFYELVHFSFSPFDLLIHIEMHGLDDLLLNAFVHFPILFFSVFSGVLLLLIIKQLINELLQVGVFALLLGKFRKRLILDVRLRDNPCFFLSFRVLHRCFV